MTTISSIIKTFTVFILICGANNLFSQQIRVQTTTAFTCSTNEECKRKCEALGSDHTWKPNPGGSTLGTCTKKSQSLADSYGIASVAGTHKILAGHEINDDSLKTLRLRFILNLMEKKQWVKTDIDEPSIPLSILECEALGGTVQYHPGCYKTLLKCSNRGYAACITEVKLTE